MTTSSFTVALFQRLYDSERQRNRRNVDSVVEQEMVAAKFGKRHRVGRDQIGQQR